MNENNEINKPEDVSDLFVRQEYEVIMPFRGNDIWNKAKYDVRIFNDGDRKVVLVRLKEKVVE